MGNLAIIYWIFASVFGNKLIKLSLFGIPTFYVLVSLCALYYFYRFKSIHRAFYFDADSTKMLKAFGAYAVISIVYIIFSYLNFFTYVFSLDDVEYATSYVLRQGYIVLTFPIILSISYDINRYSDFWNKKLCNKKILVFIWLLVMVMVEAGYVDSISERPFVFAIASLLVCVFPRSVVSWLIMAATILRGISLFNSSSSVLALFVSFIAYFFYKVFVILAKKNFGIRFWLLTVVCAVIVLIMADNIVSWISKDSNSEWRLQYWINELKVLFRTKLIGVGYGTTYASSSIYSEINNPYVFLTEAEGGTGLFVITQHNSFMNILYRLGIAGLVIGIRLWIVCPMQLLARRLTNCDEKYRRFLKWGLMNVLFNLVIIFLNPGLESPRFAFGFLVSIAIAVGLCLSSNKNTIELSTVK